MSKSEAARVIEALAASIERNPAQFTIYASGTNIGVLGIGAPGRGPGVVRIGTTGGIGVSGTASVGGSSEGNDPAQHALALRGLADALEAGDDTGKLQAMLARLEGPAVVLEIATSVLQLAGLGG